MRRVVADTNVLISALMFGGLPGTFLDMALLPAFTLVTSAVLLGELDDKLRTKFKVSTEDAAAIRAKLTGVADIVEPDIILDAVKDDPDDNRVLECAIKGQADYIISGDRHLLKLGSYDGLPIMTVRQFFDATQAESTP